MWVPRRLLLPVRPAGIAAISVFTFVLLMQSGLAGPLEDEMRGMQSPKPSFRQPTPAPIAKQTNPPSYSTDFGNEAVQAAAETGPADSETEADAFETIDDPGNQPDSLNLRFWNSARDYVRQVTDAVRSFPFHNPFWAPSIVGDYTEALFSRVEAEFFPDHPEPSPSPSPAPEQQ